MSSEKHNLNFWCLCVIVTYAIFSLVRINDAEAYQMLIPPGEDGKCEYRGDKLEVGEQPGPVPCQRLTCKEDGSILVEGCGKLWIENCNRGERINREKPYPECCKLIYKCKNPDGSSYYIEKDALTNNTTKSENST